MNPLQFRPRLAGISGPLQGRLFVLDGEVVSIGRERSNTIWINDISVSRKHASIQTRGDRLVLKDLGSFNGTRVNGVPINERELEHSDTLAFGDSVFTFLSRDETEESDASRLSVTIDEGRIGEQPTTQLRVEDALSLEKSEPAQSDLVKQLNDLLKATARLNANRCAGPLQSQILEFIFEAIPAERGAILLIGEGPDEFASVLGRHRTRGIDVPVPASRSVINRVLKEQAGLLISDVSSSDTVGASGTLHRSGVTSLMAAPLLSDGAVTGVIYLDASDPRIRFTREHLQYLTAMGSIAGSILDRVRHADRIQAGVDEILDEIDTEYRMVGESPQMKAIHQLVAQFAALESPVLITGEGGVGKELAARAIHRQSSRSKGRFVSVNCAAFSETLLTNEIFGHEKSAFTGALTRRQGKLEVASEGTLFLDAVDGLPVELQTRLLHVMDTGLFERAGGSHPISVNVRFIASTGEDIESAVKKGKFLPALHGRLASLHLPLLPLRDRRADIPLLASYFTARHSQRCKRRVRGISTEARLAIESYDWPGNIRELENAIERAVIHGTTESILPEDLPETVLEAEPVSGVNLPQYCESLIEAKKQILLKTLHTADGDPVAAADMLGLHRDTMLRLLRNLRLESALRQ